MTADLYCYGDVF